MVVAVELGAADVAILCEVRAAAVDGGEAAK
jgi:hypothetical protein